MTVSDYLDNVKDKETFIIFVRALAEEREQAQKLEKESPVRYQLGGALDWQNGDIASYLWAALAYFEPNPNREPVRDEATWQEFAEFLYMGKIYE
jgi:hypothetical protein